MKQTSPKSLKKSKQLSPFREIANLSRYLFSITSFIVGLTIMGVAYLMSYRQDIRDPSILNWQGAIWQQILIAIGTSIIASILFYVLYSNAAEERVLKDISENSAKIATEYAATLFRERFEKMLPTKIYPATPIPVEEFDQDFKEHLKDSKIYFYKGDSANVTSVRLTNLSERGYPLDKDIRLLLIDPHRVDLIEERAINELIVSHKYYSKEELIKKTQDICTNIFVTMFMLFDISHTTKVEVAFHQEHLFFRTELMDGGIFLSYYLGGEFPGTYLYARITCEYKAFLVNFRQNYSSSPNKYLFDNKMNEKKFKGILAELGCELSLDELRQLKLQRIQKYRDMNGQLGLSNN